MSADRQLTGCDSTCAESSRGCRPAGGSLDKPVGTVWFAWAGPQGVEALHRRLDGDRAAVRAASVAIALQGLVDRLG